MGTCRIAAVAALTLGIAACGGGSSGAPDPGTRTTSTARGACTVQQNGWDLCEDVTEAECVAAASTTTPVFHAGTQCNLSGYDRNCTSPWHVRANDICPGLPDPCTTQHAGQGCSMCTSAACGFCASSGVCMSGDAAGPLHDTCPAWIKSAPSCPGADPCTYRYGGCATCTALAGCGYCATNYTCSSGTSSGPGSGTCANWQYSSCSTSTGDTCNQCLASCRGLSGCCTGSGCICESACP